MAASERGADLQFRGAHGRGGNAAGGTLMAGCLGDACFCDLSARWMARVAAADSCGIRSAENAGCGGEFFTERISGEANGHGAGFLDGCLGRGYHLPEETPAAELRAASRDP